VGQITKIKKDLRDAYEIVANIAKANGYLLFDPEWKVVSITPAQERLLKATRNYAAVHSLNANFEDISQDIEKHYGYQRVCKIA
jgi:hypothetical protein